MSEVRVPKGFKVIKKGVFGKRETIPSVRVTGLDETPILSISTPIVGSLRSFGGTKVRIAYDDKANTLALIPSKKDGYSLGKKVATKQVKTKKLLEIPFMKKAVEGRYRAVVDEEAKVVFVEVTDENKVR